MTALSIWGMGCLLLTLAGRETSSADAVSPTYPPPYCMTRRDYAFFSQRSPEDADDLDRIVKEFKQGDKTSEGKGSNPSYGAVLHNSLTPPPSDSTACPPPSRRRQTVRPGLHVAVVLDFITVPAGVEREKNERSATL